MEETYVDMLKQEFLDRKKRRPSYSKRAFARDLKLSSGFISLLFNEKRGLSPRMCITVLENLNWSELKAKNFIDSVQNKQLEKKESINTVHKENISEFNMDLDYFRLIANINHFLILEFIQTRKVRSKSEILNYFDITEIECDMVLKRLDRLRLIQKNKYGFKAINENRHLKGTPSAAIRNYHKESIARSLKSVDEQDFNERELRSVTLSIDPNKLNDAKKTVDKFIKNFMKKYANKKDGEIYQMNLQLFNHNKLRKTKENAEVDK